MAVKVVFKLGASVVEVPSEAMVRLEDGREVRAGDAPADSFAWRIDVEERDWPSGRTINAVHTPLGYRVGDRAVYGRALPLPPLDPPLFSVPPPLRAFYAPDEEYPGDVEGKGPPPSAPGGAL